MSSDRAMVSAEGESAIIDTATSPKSAVPGHLQAYITETHSAEIQAETQPAIKWDAQPREDSGDQEAPAAHREEVFKLKRMVAEAEHSRLQALLSAADLGRQLAEAQQNAGELRAQIEAASAAKAANTPVEEKLAQFEELKKHLRLFEKQVAREQRDSRAELVSIRGQWHNTQKLLEAEHRARKIEASQAAAQISRLESDVISARSEVVASDKRRAADRRNWLIVGAAIATVLVLVVVTVVWRKFATPQGALAAQAAVRPVGAPVAANTQTASAAAGSPRGNLPGTGFSMLSQQGFAKELSRLNRALDGFSGRRPEDILREVHLKNLARGNSVCSFQWNGGQPAMLFSESGSGGNALTKAITGCAEAVENYR